MRNEMTIGIVAVSSPNRVTTEVTMTKSRELPFMPAVGFQFKTQGHYFKVYAVHYDLEKCFGVITLEGFFVKPEQQLSFLKELVDVGWQLAETKYAQKFDDQELREALISYAQTH